MNNEKERKDVDIDRNSYIRLFVYIFLIIITGTALLMLNYQPTVGKAYVFSTERITGILNLPDSGNVNEIFTVKLDLDVAEDLDKGILLIADVDPDLKIVKPINDGLVGENTITWTLFPEDQIVSFDVLSNSSGDFNISMTWMVDDEQGNVFGVLTIVSCETNEIQNYTCADGSSVPWCVCEAGDWVCITTPESVCPHICSSNDDCPASHFCEFEECADNTGICIEIPEQCPTLYEPVCGCDNITYTNDCSRKSAGVSKSYDGECIIKCVDNDGDGYNTSVGECGITDCDDNNSVVNPDATELCGDIIDNDCDDLVDCDDGDCSGEPVCIVECVEPTDGMIITEDTKFCAGTYDMPNGISIGADDVELDCDGAVLQGSGLNLIFTEKKSGILMIDVNNVTIKNCIINNYDYAINLDNNSNINITDNELDSEYIIVMVQFSTDIDIMNNNIMTDSDTIRTSIATLNSDLLSIISNNIENLGSGHGIWLWNSGNSGDRLNVIRDNTITTHGYDANSVRIEASANTQVLNNDITTYDAYGFGVYISISPNSVISNNYIRTHRERAHGIFLMVQNDTVISYNNIHINSTYTISQTDIILYDQTFPIEERDSYNNRIIDNIVNGICSCSSEAVPVEGGTIGQASGLLTGDIDENHTYVCTKLAEQDVYAIVDVIDKNGIIETDELLHGIDRWVTDEVSTSIILEAINLWINP